MIPGKKVPKVSVFHCDNKKRSLGKLRISWDNIEAEVCLVLSYQVKSSAFERKLSKTKLPVLNGKPFVR